MWNLASKLRDPVVWSVARVMDVEVASTINDNVDKSSSSFRAGNADVRFQPHCSSGFIPVSLVTNE